MCDKVEAVDLSDAGALRQKHLYNLDVMGYIMHLPLLHTNLQYCMLFIYSLSTPLTVSLLLNLPLFPSSLFPQVIIISTAPDFSFFPLICE